MLLQSRVPFCLPNEQKDNTTFGMYMLLKEDLAPDTVVKSGWIPGENGHWEIPLQRET